MRKKELEKKLEDIERKDFERRALFSEKLGLGKTQNLYGKSIIIAQNWEEIIFEFGKKLN